MTNIIIKSTTNCISIELGDCATEFDDIKSHVKKTLWEKTSLQTNCVEVIIKHFKSLSLHFEENEFGALIVDSIDEQEPESLEDLHEKLCAIME